jgi:4-hydroxy-tetrahydrodipicolinate synthase
MKFEGVFPILATPFHDDETFDQASMQNLVELMKRIGVDGITVLGVLGEANRMGDRERENVVRTAVAAAEGLPVIVGASASGTRAACDLAMMAHSLGASAVMVTPHAEPVPSDERVLGYFAAIARSMPLPIVLQDHPASSAVHMTTKALLSIIREVPAVACIKEEAVPTAPRIRALAGELPRRVPILTGLGALYGLFDLEAGSDGFNTGFAFPEALIAMRAAALQNDWGRVRDIYRRFLPLIVFEQQPGVAIRKEILRLRGALSSSTVRHPGAAITGETAAQLRRLIDSVLPGQDLSQPLAI